MRTLVAIAAALPAFVSAGAATAQSYSGNWPLTVTHSRVADGTYCLTLTDDGSVGWKHSGAASLTGARLGGNLPFGTFQLIGHILIATIQQPGGTGQNAGLVFSAPAGNGNIRQGAYDQVYGGEASDTGMVNFGVKGSC